MDEKLANTIKQFTEDITNIQKECINSAKENTSKIEDLDMRTFMEKSLKNAVSGNLSSKDFLEQLKNMNNAC